MGLVRTLGHARTSRNLAKQVPRLVDEKYLTPDEYESIFEQIMSKLRAKIN